MSANKEDMLRQFCVVTGADENRSRSFLESSNWQLKVALSSFHEHDGKVENLPAAANVPPMSDSGVYSPPRSPSSQNKDKEKGNSQSATLDSEQQDSSSEDDVEMCNCVTPDWCMPKP